MNCVLDNGPWLFDQNLLVLKVIKLGGMPLKVPLDTAYFCVQVHNIPYGYSNLGYARKIGNHLGKIISWDDNHFVENREAYMRVRVMLDVRKPLKVGTTLKKNKGEVIG
ncbi:unnamed protein product [Cuscuta epithymum]|uniref:DUF4283 domain-containing protein n=1 Tax=Cuscuta epithymum TaxID=186058 RepID=A0AAV0DDH9_9ASTE|nr:unnamed protein product [Cuscuta epithymum]